MKPKSYREKTDPFLFISYSHKDKDTVYRYLSALNEAKYRFWYDEGIMTGKEWADEIGWRIANCAQFIVFLSPNAIASENVQNEIHVAVTFGKELCIIYLEPTELSYGLILQIGRKQALYRYQYTDAAFEKLLLDTVSKNTYIDEPKSTLEDFRQLEKDYERITLLSRGGVGAVYSASHKRTGNPVIIKRAVVEEGFHLKHSQPFFLNERNALQRLSHCPYVPYLVDWIETSDRIMLVESRISGTHPDSHTHPTPEDVMVLTRKLLCILTYLEDAGIVHMGISPWNIHLDSRGSIFLTDFSCSRILAPANPLQEMHTATFLFFPPEMQAEEQSISYATDIYGLGKTVLSVLLGEKTAAVFSENISPGTGSVRRFRKEVTPAFENILLKMIEEDPANRYQHAEDILRDLEPLISQG